MNLLLLFVILNSLSDIFNLKEGFFHYIRLIFTILGLVTISCSIYNMIKNPFTIRFNIFIKTIEALYPGICKIFKEEISNKPDIFYNNFFEIKPDYRNLFLTCHDSCEVYKGFIDGFCLDNNIYKKIKNNKIKKFLIKQDNYIYDDKKIVFLKDEDSFHFNYNYKTKHHNDYYLYALGLMFKFKKDEYIKTINVKNIKMDNTYNILSELQMKIDELDLLSRINEDYYDVENYNYYEISNLYKSDYSSKKRYKCKKEASYLLEKYKDFKKNYEKMISLQKDCKEKNKNIFIRFLRLGKSFYGGICLNPNQNFNDE